MMGQEIHTAMQKLLGCLLKAKGFDVTYEVEETVNKRTDIVAKLDGVTVNVEVDIETVDIRAHDKVLQKISEAIESLGKTLNLDDWRGYNVKEE